MYVRTAHPLQGQIIITKMRAAGVLFGEGRRRRTDASVFARVCVCGGIVREVSES